MLFGARLALIAVAAVLITFAVVAASTRTAPEAAAAPKALAEDRPNIVVIETDDQTADSMRFMENVNRLLVRQGVRFDNSYASYPLCCPSRATFLTGQYAHNHGVLGNAPPLGGYIALDHTNTLPIWLQQAGYYTALVGKYLNGYGNEETRNDLPPGWSEWRATTRQPYLGFTMNENGRLVTYPENQENYQTDVFTRKAVDVIRRRAPSDTPFFLWLTYFAPHSGAPLDDDDAPATGVTAGPSPAARHQNRFDEEPLPMPPSFDEADVSDKPLFIRNRRRLTINQVEAIQESYQQRLESLLAVDEGVAQVVRALRNADELANTVIVFTSDNGFMHGEHRIPAGKSVVYEPSARVPLVIRGPGIPRARRVQDVVSNVDLAPTFLSLAQATATLPLDGRSLLPLARDRLADFGRDLMLESNTYVAIHTQRYVYVEHRAGGRELYDLQSDRYELQSRHVDLTLARIRGELARRLATLRICLGSNCRVAPRLQLRLAVVNGRSVRAGVTGRDLGWVTATRFFVAGTRVASDVRTPFRVVLPSTLFGGATALVRVHVRTLDGRGMTITRKIPLPQLRP